MFVICGYFRIGAIWPIQDRECVLFGFGVDDLKRNNRMLCCFDTNEANHKDILNKFNIKLPAPQNGKVTVDVTIGGFLLERIENEKNKKKIIVFGLFFLLFFFFVFFFLNFLFFIFFFFFFLIFFCNNFWA
eukprot:985943_1